ncbi:GWxTD domain-containing protein [Candidatus Zixiibacteriota bacterium]
MHSKNGLAVYSGTVISNNPVYDSLVLLEFPFSLNRSDFEFFKADTTDNEKLYARIFAQVDLFTPDGKAYDSVRTYFSVAVNSIEEAQIKDYRLFNKLSLMVKPGLYSARLTIIDVKSKLSGEYFFDNININPPVKDKLFIAGTCLAYQLVFVGEKSREDAPLMYKNGYNILVNPVSVYAENDTIAYLYGEVFNLDYNSDNNSYYLVSISILDNMNNLYERLGSRKQKKSGKSSVITEAIDISNWPNGNYKIELSVYDLTNSQSDTVLIPINKVSPTEVLSAMESSTVKYENPYDTTSLDVKINLVRYLLEESQKRTLNSLSDTGKINFLAQYWKEHDENPATTICENQIEIIHLYNYANQYFSNNDIKTNGWKSDRGRIMMTYGLWDERDEIQSPRIGNPYDVWYYRSLKSGGIFVFEDWTGNDDFRLVHSDVYGEVFSKAWDDKIKQGYIEILE